MHVTHTDGVCRLSTMSPQSWKIDTAKAHSIHLKLLCESFSLLGFFVVLVCFFFREKKKATVNHEAIFCFFLSFHHCHLLCNTLCSISPS